LQTGAPNVTGTGLTFSNTQVTVGTSASSATLAFSLGAGSGGSAYNFSSPNTNTTYMTLTGSSALTFALGSTDTVALNDLTAAATLTLRQGVPYLLVSATGASTSEFSNLITASGGGASTVLSIDGTGYVVGVLTSTGLSSEASFTGSIANTGNLTSADYNPISISQYGPTGPLTGPAIYADPVLYLQSGVGLEVVPEPGTWALMLGGLALLLVTQRRRNKKV
jgi:hypothetical protein